MNRKITIGLVLGALVGCASSKPEQKPTTPAPVAQTPPPAPPPPSTPDAEFRAKKPEPLAATPHFDAPVPVEKKLKNGLTVLITENHQVPLVVAELVVKTGTDGNPVSQPGLAEFTAAMMDEGTKKRSATELAEQLENLAAELAVNSAQDSTRVHLNCLTETLPQALDLMSDVALHPAFKQADVDRVKKSYLTELAQRMATPQFLALNATNRALYGPNHPWGQPVNGTPEAVGKLGPKDLSKWHDTYFVPGNAVLSISGDVKADALMPVLEKQFGAWKGKAPAKKAAALAAIKPQRHIEVVDHPGSQSVVVVAQRMLSANDPDVVPFKTANYILGGLFSSRLNLNLREDKAYSYGVRSTLQMNDKTGVFITQGNIIAVHTPEAITEMEKEYDRFATGEVTADELAAAKSAYTRSLPSQLETNDAVATSMGTLVLQGLPLDYYAKLPEKVAAVNAADVARVAKKYITPASWPVVVVGPYGSQTDKLTALNLGTVAVEPPPGTPAAPAKGAPPASKAPVAKSK
ncbi:MAG: insulinase family protein [Deltaproteobacteria bacterium]|nr:insulinase family protein [Deltaproteobacteria bacterium]